MTDLSIKTSDLRPGIIISEDVFANTNNAIIRKNTVLLPNHLDVLKAFDIREVKIAEQHVVKREEDMEAEEGIVDPDTTFNGMAVKETDLNMDYREAVEKYKKEFMGWRAGRKPNITKIRSILLPLLEKCISQKKMLNILNDSTNSIDYLYHHSIAVSIVAMAISLQMGHPKGQALQLGIAGALTDCGMAKINPSITEKPAFLTEKEFNEVKKHVIYSFQMVQDTPLLRQEMKLAILQHHERLDGSGYPRGSKMEQVSVFAQILAVADVFHAMTSERIYRPKESPFKVIEMIREEEFGKFNLKVVQALLDLAGNLSIGSKVQLTNGDIGEIIFVHRDARLRPMVKKEDGTILDLTINRHIAVEKVLE